VSVIGRWLAVSASTLIVGVLFVLLAPAALYAAERVVRERLGATVAWGVAITIGVPLLEVLAPLIPVAGALVGLAATVLGLGALAVALWRPAGPARLRRGRRRRLQAVAHQLPDAPPGW
jgi:hypothetical protein